MALFAKDPQKILQDSIDFIKSNTRINTVSPGGKLYALMSIMQRELGSAYSLFDRNIAVGFIYGAYGKYLDYLGDIFGVVRNNGRSSSVTEQDKIVKFYTLENTFGALGTDIVIPAGTKIWSERGDQKVEFYVKTDISLPNNTNEAYASVVASEFGASNNIESGAITQHNFSNKQIFVTNVDSIDTGEDKESDENYRYRIINQKLSSVTGNETAIRLAALSVKGVADVNILKYRYGIGTSMVMVKSTTPIVSNLLLAEVQREIDKVNGHGMKVIAGGPEYITVRSSVSLVFHNDATNLDRLNARAAARIAMIDYVNNLDIGEPLYVNECASAIISSHSKIKTIGVPNRFFDYITISKKEIQANIVSNYTPTEYQKLIVQNNTDIKVN